MAVGLFKSGQFLDVDFDHQFIPTEKHDATYSYKKAFGYFPGVASVGGVIVHVENRDGNTPVKFCQAETLKRLFASLRKHGLFIYRFRADCVSYSKEIVETIDAHSNQFYLRASNCESAYTEFAELDGWKTIEINYQKCEVAASSSTGSWKRKAIASSFSARALSMSRPSSVTLSATSIDAY